MKIETGVGKSVESTAFRNPGKRVHTRTQMLPNVPENVRAHSNHTNGLSHPSFQGHDAGRVFTAHHSVPTLKRPPVTDRFHSFLLSNKVRIFSSDHFAVGKAQMRACRVPPFRSVLLPPAVILAGTQRALHQDDAVSMPYRSHPPLTFTYTVNSVDQDV